MAATIQKIDITVFHSDVLGTGDAKVVFNITVPSDANPGATNDPVATYNGVDIGLSAANRTTIENLIGNIRQAALAKLKADFNGLV